MGCWFCMRTAPIPLPGASVSMVKGKEKLERVRTSAVLRAILSELKACVAVGD